MKNTLLIALLLAAAHANAGEFQLKNRSTFEAGAAAHNPFWPIGWVKSSVAAAPGAESQSAATLKAENFVVSSILLNEPPLAVVNGKEMAEGEVIAMNVDSKTLLIQLASVQDGQVVLRYRGQNIVVPLHRRGDKITGLTTAQR